MALTKEQIARYSRQLRLPEIGVRGHERLAQASVLIVGAGGLGCPAALYLASAGVGRLGLLDDQSVELSNLHRQILHTTAAVGQTKVHSAARALGERNPDVRVEAMPIRVTAETALALIAGYDLVLDGSDNFPTRYLVNDACVIADRPLIHAGAIGLRGQLLTIHPRHSACLRCVFPEPPAPESIPSCQEAGVLGSTVGVLGTLMAHEALKWLLGLGQVATDRMIVFDGTATRFREVPVRRDLACAVCGEQPRILAPMEDALVLTSCSMEDR